MAEDYHTGLDLQRMPLAEAKHFASRPFKSREITTWKYRGMNTHLWEMHVSIYRGTSQLAARQSAPLGKVEIWFFFRCVITVHDKGIFITSFNPNTYLWGSPIPAAQHCWHKASIHIYLSGSSEKIMPSGCTARGKPAITASLPGAAFDTKSAHVNNTVCSATRHSQLLFNVKFSTQKTSIDQCIGLNEWLGGCVHAQKASKG